MRSHRKRLGSISLRPKSLPEAFPIEASDNALRSAGAIFHGTSSDVAWSSITRLDVLRRCDGASSRWLESTFFDPPLRRAWRFTRLEHSLGDFRIFLTCEC